MIKRVYSQPTTKALVIRFAGAIAQSKVVNDGSAGFDDSGAFIDDQSGENWW